MRYRDWQLVNWERQSKEAAESLRNGPGQNLAKMVLPYPVKGNFTPAGWRKVDLNVRNDIKRLLSGAHVNLVIDFVRRGNLVDSGKALKHSLDFCELSCDLVSLAGMHSCYANWRYAAHHNPDDLIIWATVAEAAGLVAGNVDAANNASLLRSEGYLKLGEYDSTLAAIDRVRRRSPFGLSKEIQVEAAKMAGVIEIRRGKPKQGLAIWQSELETLLASDALAARLRWTVITCLSHDPRFRADLTAECDALLDTLRGMNLPTNRPDGIPTIDEVAKALRDISEGRGRTPDFLRPWSKATNDQIDRTRPDRLGFSLSKTPQCHLNVWRVPLECGGFFRLERVAFNRVHPIESNTQHSQSRFVLGCS